MIKPGEIIAIQRTVNGWIVRREHRRDELIDPSEWQVFNHMGYASSAGDVTALPSLLTFIEQHFSGKESGRDASDNPL